MHVKVIVAFVAALAIGSTASAFAVPSNDQPLAFSVSFPSSVRARAADGRVYVIVSRAPKRVEPRFQIDITDGVPFWGRDVSGLRPGGSASVGAQPDVYGYPLAALDQLPAGDYTVQAFLNVSTTFHRSAVGATSAFGV